MVVQSLLRLKKSVFLIILTLSLFSCTNSNKNLGNDIVVSILPQKYIVEQMLGDKVKVHVMVLPGNSPATYSPAPSQIKALHQSKLYIRIGHIGFEESWINKFASIKPEMKIEDSSQGIELIYGEVIHGDHVHKGGVEPHIWTSPKTFLKVVYNTKALLLKYYPEFSVEIEKNAKELASNIEALDKKYDEELAPFAGNKFLIFHPAYSYLAQDYNLQQMTIETDGKEPSLKWLKKVISESQANNINTIFIQKEFDSKNAKLVAQELGLHIIEVKPLSENWLKESENFLENLTTALKQ